MRGIPHTDEQGLIQHNQGGGDKNALFSEKIEINLRKSIRKIVLR
jgi:hypothetical protein